FQRANRAREASAKVMREAPSVFSIEETIAADHLASLKKFYSTRDCADIGSQSIIRGSSRKQWKQDRPRRIARGKRGSPKWQAGCVMSSTSKYSPAAEARNASGTACKRWNRPGFPKPPNCGFAPTAS